MLRNIFYCLLEFSVEFIKLFSVLYFVMQFRLKERKKVIIYSVCALAIVIGAELCGWRKFFSVNGYICLLYIILILDGRKKIFYTITTYFGICLLDLMAGSVFLLTTNYDMVDLFDDRKTAILANSLSISVLAAITAISIFIRKRNEKKGYITSQRIGIFYLLLIVLGEMAISLFITAFQLEGSGNKALTVTLCIGSMIFLIVCTIMIVNYTSKNHYKEINEINEKLLQEQADYYSALLKKDNETIKFRHDIKNHINCMYLLFNNGKYDELKDYFDKIGATLSELKPSVQTGNDMISAILNDAVTKYPNVKCEIEGKVANDIRLSHIDMCTIFSNLYENAFYAADNSEEKIVNISFRFAGSNLFCEIRNTVSHKVEITNNKLVSEKADKINHGHGTENARLCAEANNGMLLYSCTEQYFTAELTLPML